jgi:hypothetical protein
MVACENLLFSWAATAAGLRDDNMVLDVSKYNYTNMKYDLL